MFFTAKDGEISLQTETLGSYFFLLLEKTSWKYLKKEKHWSWYSYFSKQVVNLRIRMVLEWVWEKWADGTGWPFGTDLWGTDSPREPPPPETEWSSTMARNFMFSGPGLFVCLTGWQWINNGYSCCQVSFLLLHVAHLLSIQDRAQRSWFSSVQVSSVAQSCQPFVLGGQSTGASALASFLPMNIQDWSSEWTGWISLKSKGLSRVFSNTTVQTHQFFGTLPSSLSNSHIHTWPQEKP